MADSVVTLRPNGTVASGGWGVVGAGSADAALSDNSDASYVTPGAGTMVIDFAASGIPADAVVHAVTIRARVGTSGGNDSIRFAVRNAAGVSNTSHLASVSSTITTVTLAADTTAPGGATWTPTIVDGLTVAFLGASVANVYELYVDVAYNQAPAVTVTAPTGTVTTTSQPTVTWTYADPEGDTQERYHVKIFDAAVYSAGGFDPETSSAAWDSGEVVSAATTVAAAHGIPNGATYRAYVKAADAGSGGRYGAWALSGFFLNPDPPATPDVFPTPDPPNARVVLALQDYQNMLTTNQASVETDTTGLLARTNCAIARSTAQAANGTASMRVTATALGAVQAGTLTGTSAVHVTPLQQYTAVLSSRAAASGAQIAVIIDWYTAAGVYISSPQGSYVTDTTTGFTQASVTATAPSNAAYAAVSMYSPLQAAGEVHYIDKLSLAPGGFPTWNRGGLTSSQVFQVQRSADGGDTWADVRFDEATRIFGYDGKASMYDYEAPPGVLLTYRARIVSNIGPLTSAWGTQTTTTLAITQSWMKVPEDPSLNIPIDLQLPVRTKCRERQTPFEPIGRRRPVVLRDTILGEEGPLVIDCYGNAERDAIDLIRANQRTVLIQTPLGDNWYSSLGDNRDSDLREGQSVTNNYRQITIPFLEVDAP